MCIGIWNFKKFNELYNCICVCMCTWVCAHDWEHSSQLCSMLMLKLKHYNLFSSATVTGFIRPPHMLNLPYCVCVCVCVHVVDGSICENAVYRFVVCFILFLPKSFLLLSFLVESTFFPSQLHITCWHIVSVLPFLAFTLMKIYFCWTHSARVCTYFIRM